MKRSISLLKASYETVLKRNWVEFHTGLHANCGGKIRNASTIRSGNHGALHRTTALCLSSWFWVGVGGGWVGRPLTHSFIVGISIRINSQQLEFSHFWYLSYLLPPKITLMADTSKSWLKSSVNIIFSWFSALVLRVCWGVRQANNQLIISW